MSLSTPLKENNVRREVCVHACVSGDTGMVETVIVI